MNNFALRPTRAFGRGLYGLSLFLSVWLAAAISAQPSPSQALPSLAPMIEKISPAVVNISVSGRVTEDNPLAQDEFFRRFFDFFAFSALLLRFRNVYETW